MTTSILVIELVMIFSVDADYYEDKIDDDNDDNDIAKDLNADHCHDGGRE